MANPTPDALHAVNIPLTNLSVAWMQQDANFIATKVFPVVPVAQQSNRYYKYDRSEWNRAEARLRAPATESAGGGWTLSTDTYFADVWAVHKDNADQDYANADSAFDLDQEAAEWCALQMLLRQDIQWLGKYFTTSIWTTDQTGVASAPSTNQFLQWNVANSTPITDVRTQITNIALRTGGTKPNTLVLGPQVFQTLIDHPTVLSRIQYTQTAIGTEDILARLFGVERVFVPWGVQNTAVEGATEASSFLVGKSALLVYAAPSPAMRRGSGGYTFAWTGYVPGSAMGVNINRFRKEEIKANRVEGESAFDMKLVDAAAGVFFASAIG